MKSFITITAIVASLSILLFSSCSKDKTTNTTSTKTLFYFHLHTNIDTSEIVLDGTYPCPTDSAVTHTQYRNFTIHSGGYAITNIRLVKSTNDTVFLNDTVHAIAGTEVYKVDSIPYGTYIGVVFNVSGFNINGNVDTSSTGNSVANVAYNYVEDPSLSSKVISGDHAVAFPSAGEFVAKDSTPVFIHLIGDYAITVRGINLKSELNSSTHVSQQMAYHIPFMFHYEE